MMKNTLLCVASFAGAALLCFNANAVDVVTQHNDTQRTGWNAQETVLTASNVKSTTFGLLHAVTLDDQVDAQPLVLANEPIGGANRTVVYAVTENNTVYAIDAASGTVLLHKNFGTPVSKSVFGNCNNNAAHVGIAATPVIDRTAGRLYLVTYTLESGVAIYRLHALSLTTLTDAVAPVVVKASHTLTNGTTYTFQAGKMRQRAALLEANGNIYVGFTSFCDFFANLSRGWVLGWNASTLKPLAANYLADSQAPSTTNNFFLSTIWMSGNGLAASTSGSLFFATGNSQNGTYSSTNNLEESVINLSSDLTQVKDFFTPSNVNTMNDQDLGAGGVLLIPPQPGSVPNLATALGKDGRLFLLNQQNLGQFTAGGPDKDLGTTNVGACLCAESYYKGPTGVGRVVTSAGSRVIVWQVQTSPTVALVKYETMPAISTGQDAGFFTSISSNGSTSGTIIIWAVSRPINASPANVVLSAFNVANSSLLFSANAGTWPNTGGNANIVPVVANGQVFVASNQQLAIFGPITPGATLASPISTVASQTKEDKVSGWIDQINGTELVLRKRNGTHVTVDAKPAEDAFQSAPIGMEEAVTAIGTYDAQGVLHAQTIVRAKNSRKLWPPDLGGN